MFHKNMADILARNMVQLITIIFYQLLKYYCFFSTYRLLFLSLGFLTQLTIPPAVVQKAPHIEMLFPFCQ